MAEKSRFTNTRSRVLELREKIEDPESNTKPCLPVSDKRVAASASQEKPPRP